MFALIPRKPGDEVHTSNAEEKAKTENEWSIQSAKTQIVYAVCGALTAGLVMTAVILLG